MKSVDLPTLGKPTMPAFNPRTTMDVRRARWGQDKRAPDGGPMGVGRGVAVDGKEARGVGKRWEGNVADRGNAERRGAAGRRGGEDRKSVV